jgi:hypothetical protein
MIKIQYSFFNILQYNIRLLKVNSTRNLCKSFSSTIQLKLQDTANESSVEPLKGKALKSSTKNEEVPDLFLEILKKHVKSNKYTGHISAMKQYRSETGIEVSDNIIRNAIEILAKELGPECINNDLYIVKNRESDRRYKLKDRHLKLLKSYLVEDKYIGPSQANKALYEETGLLIGDKSIYAVLNSLRVKMGNDYINLDLNNLKNSQLGEISKLKDSHIECLKNYLKEDSNIGPTKANRKLYEETNFKVSNYTVGQALIKLRKQVGIEYSHPRTVKDVQSDKRTKIKQVHLECLKKYLIEDKYIGPSQANKMLNKETGLVVIDKTIENCLKKLKYELGEEYSNLDFNLVKSKRIKEQAKIKDSHLECLKKYLNMDGSIGTFQASKMLNEETGLVVSDGIIRRALVRLRKEMGLNSQLDDKSSSKFIKRKPSVRLNGLRLEILKKFLIEDKYIGNAAARRKFYQETGLEITNNSIARALTKLRDAMGPEYAILNTKIGKNLQRDRRSKLKSLHLECLKKYLKDDKYIGPVEANRKLHAETGLNIRVGTILYYLSRIKKEMGPEYSNLDLSIVRDRKAKNRSKLKDLHLECLKKYLSENPVIKALEARDKLYQETNLEMPVSKFYVAFAKFKRDNQVN